MDIDFMGCQMFEESINSKLCVSFGELAAISQEGGSQLRATDGVLELWEIQSFHKRPIMGDIVEILDVYLRTGKRFVLGFNISQIALGVMLSLACTSQPALPDDACDSADGRGQFELTLEARSAEAGCSLTLGDDLILKMP